MQLSTTLEEAIEDSFEEPLQKESIAGEGHKDKRTKLVQKVYLASAPARIDIAGGWSDTPPICYELGGAVRTKSMYTINYLVPT